MESNQPDFQLEPVSPADREAQAREKRRITREATKRARDRAAAQGVATASFMVRKDYLAVLDAIQAERGLKNRSAALETVLRAAFDHKQELGL
ncbi:MULTISPECIES: hypothetical protein [Sphingomonadaceae]|uniref:Uncharacterized protein n=1 Tax=Sphingobium baderi TaxID=1332080 RepID=A0A0S3F684_9SPHN|nr:MULTISPECIES: hypothetical protein [Sphingomonadaceae]ALR23166.1 hypothetical protein ATN00_21960 [Sphingobium baderi]CDO34421.1 hypothetical protein SPHV1_1550005 [Novosphingobium sp. KN65.2]